jgi:hypothetical protein
MMTDAPDRLSCSISRRGAERTNANEMQGTEPAATHCPVRPPRHASALTLNTLSPPSSPPNRNHSKISFACNSVLRIPCHCHRKVTDRHRKITYSSGVPETGSVALGTNCGESISREIGNPVPAQNQQRNASREASWPRTDASRDTFSDCRSAAPCPWKPRRSGAAFPHADRETGLCWPGTAARSSRV